MKKILYMLLCLFLLVGCTQQTGGNTGSSSTTTSNTDPVVTTTTPKPIITTTTTNHPKPEYHDQIINGDFSAIAGEYVNPEGKIKILDADGLGENQTGDSVRYSNGKYFMNIYDKEGYGHLMIIYDIGIEVTSKYDMQTTLTLNTDTSKIRIFHGQASPSSPTDIYTKKEE